MQDLSCPRLRPDFRKRQRLLGDNRPADRLVAHYILERSLSDRLRRASAECRSLVYAQVYRDLFISVSDHLQHRGNHHRSSRVYWQLRQITRKLSSDAVFLEIGCGDAALVFAVSHNVCTAYGLDVTDELIDFEAAPPNFTFLPTAGVEIPLPSNSVDFAYSDQVMEHLHPDDASNQLAEVYRVLKPGAHYICVTPSRVTGPHDISCYFDYEATCFHLKEYDYAALRALFRKAGFRNLACTATVRGYEMHLPYHAIRALERSLLMLPLRIRAHVTHFGALHAVLGLNLTAQK